MTVKNIYKINTTHWSHKIGTIGDVAENIADIIQCYETIIMTQKGSVILNPNLGWNIRKFHSKPINEVAPVMKNELLKFFFFNFHVCLILKNKSTHKT